MKRLNSILVTACAVLIAAAYIVPALPVLAASSASLSIVPKKNYTIDPGKTIKDKLTIRNLDADESLELNLRVVDFTFTDDGGAPKLLLAEDEPLKAWSLKPYLTVPKTVTIEPKSSKSIDMSVAIPANRGGGSLYSAIVYSSGAAEGGNVGLSASGVTLAFANVTGDVKQNLTLEKFGAYSLATKDRTADYVSVTMKKPQHMAFTIKNMGNVTEAPVGTITLKNMFGKEQAIGNVNPNESLALIGQTRTITSCIKLKAQDVDFEGKKSEAKTCADPSLWPGRYSASLSLFYGQNGNATQEIAGKASFWYLPMWFLIVLTLVVAALAYGGWRAYNNIRAKLYGPQFKKSRRKK